MELLPETLLSKILNTAGLRSVKNVLKTNKSLASLLKPFIRGRIVMHIKQFWQWYGPFTSTNLLIARFQAAKLTDHQMLTFGFDAVVVHLRKRYVVFNAKLLITRLLMVSISLCPQLKGTITPMNFNIRVFLAAYMIVFFPRDVFEQFDAREQAVMHEGRALLAIVETFIAHHETHSSFNNFPRANCLALFAQMQSYMQAFHAWKGPDQVVITTQINNTLYALFFAAREIPPELPQDAPLRLEVEMQTTRLRAKLFQIGGAAAVNSFYDTITDALTFEIYEMLNPVDWEEWAHVVMSGIW